MDLQNISNVIQKIGDMMEYINEKIQDAYQKTILERKFDLGSGHKGNGIVIWNRAKEVHGDYENIAHIDANRKIKYYIKKPSKEVISYVEKIAKGKNPNISTSQAGKVFREDISEASEINSDDVDPKILKFVENLFKGTRYKPEKQSHWDGVHGKIVDMVDQFGGSFGGDAVRADKKMLQKILKNKDVRWVDISSIGL